MKKDAAISWWPTPPSTMINKLLALPLALALLNTAYADSSAPRSSLCNANEQVQFSCSLTSDDMVSLCAEFEGDRILALAFRHGEPGRVKQEYRVDGFGGRPFQAAVEPAGPRARVQQVWFEQGPLKYVLTHCIGGRCPYGAGLALLFSNGDRDVVVRNERCQPGPADLAWFSSKLVDFGNGGSRPGASRSSLLEFTIPGNPVDDLYPTPPFP